MAGLARGARAQDAKVLRMGVGAQVTSIDPQYHNISPNNALGSMVYGALVDTDDRSRLIPGLALAWTALSDTLWEFKLRPGVTFHNGKPFTADDVLFTFARIPTVVNSPGSYNTFIYSIDHAETPDPLTLHLHTRKPDPLLPANLSQVWMLSRATHTGATTDDFNSGRVAIGTGPFRVTAVQFGNRIDLARNDSYWGTRPAWTTVGYRQLTNEASRTAALLSGDVDFIDQVPTSDVGHLRQDPKARLSETDSLRVIYIAMDQGRTGPSPFITDNDGKPLPKNPLMDVRVRRALSIAIDRQAEVARVMEGVATPTLQFMAKGTYGYCPDLVPPRADPAEARRLLTEAGYPAGFQITLHGPNDRYPNDHRIVQAVAQMWTRIGIKTAVETAPLRQLHHPRQQAGVLRLPGLLGHAHRRAQRRPSLHRRHLRPEEGHRLRQPRPLLQPGARRHARHRRTDAGRREAGGPVAGLHAPAGPGRRHHPDPPAEERLGDAPRPPPRCPRRRAHPRAGRHPRQQGRQPLIAAAPA